MCAEPLSAAIVLLRKVSWGSCRIDGGGKGGFEGEVPL